MNNAERSHYLSNPWAIRGVAHDFELVDAWDLPIVNDAPDARALFDVSAKVLRTSNRSNSTTSMLFSIRQMFANLFGWDREANSLPIPGCRETSLRQRCEGAWLEPFAGAGDIGIFKVVYLTNTEYALESSNQLLHAVMHVGWAPSDDGSYVAQMGVWVKHRSVSSRVYLAAISPARHWIVYPAMMRALGRAWERRRAMLPPQAV